MKIIITLILSLFLLSCSSQNGLFTDDLYYYPTKGDNNNQLDSIIDTYYPTYNIYTFGGYYPYGFFYNYQYHDPFFDPFWIENTFWYPNYFYGYSYSTIYLSLLSRGFPMYFSRYYANNYFYYNRFDYMYHYPYYRYPLYYTHYNNNVVRKPRKSFNKTYIKKPKKVNITTKEYHRSVRTTRPRSLPVYSPAKVNRKPTYNRVVRTRTVTHPTHNNTTPVIRHNNVTKVRTTRSSGSRLPRQK